MYLSTERQLSIHNFYTGTILVNVFYLNASNNCPNFIQFLTYLCQIVFKMSKFALKV